MRARGTFGALALALAALGWLSSHDSTRAAYPGANGVLLFESEVSGTVHVFQMDPDGNNFHRLTNLLSTSGQPGAGGRGLQAVVNSGNDIWLVTADGANATQINNNPAYDAFPALSPDEATIAFATERDGNREIYTMAANGAQVARMTDDPATDSIPRWSPDGETIAFDSDRFGSYDVLLLDVATKAVTRITNSDAADESADWSPDGSHIVFNSNRDGNDELYVMDSSGGNPTRLTTNPASDVDPVWSPDGSQIAFASDRDGDYEVFVMPASGGEATQLTHDTDFQCCVDWMPIVAETVAGDADCNTLVNGDDGIAVLKYLDEITPIAPCIFQANLFCLDSLRVRDVLLLFQYLAGFALDLPDECPLPGE